MKIKASKMDEEYKETGTIKEIRPHSSYIVETESGSMLLRHASHLRIRPGMLEIAVNHSYEMLDV